MAKFRLKRANSGRLFLLLSALAFFAVSGAHAFKLVPMRVEFEPAGKGANQAFRLENDSTNTLAIQISMLTREMDLEGKETNAPSDDFLVYPPQVLLKPNTVQVVRVKWLGEAKPRQELAFRIMAEQLPVDLNKEKPSGTRINLVVRYLGSVYIVPKGAKPDVVIESVTALKDAEGKQRVELIFLNRGKAHEVLQNLRLTLKSGDQTVVLGEDELANVAGENILAGQKRRFTLPWPASLPAGTLHASFTLNEVLPVPSP